jgi:hypothetical protein
MELIDKVDQAMTYAQYMQGLDLQLKGNREQDKMLNYVYLNMKRMKRIEKQYEPAPYLVKLIQKMNEPITWLTITEGWCGDAAHVLPILDKLASYSFKPTLRIVLRDEHPELMDQFLTNSSRSIPKVIAIDQKGAVRSVWGPRPSSAQEMVESYKAGTSPYATYDELSAALQKWYHYDRYSSFESEFIEFLEPQIKSKEKVLS